MRRKYSTRYLIFTLHAAISSVACPPTSCYRVEQLAEFAFLPPQQCAMNNNANVSSMGPLSTKPLLCSGGRSYFYFSLRHASNAQSKWLRADNSFGALCLGCHSLFTPICFVATHSLSTHDQREMPSKPPDWQKKRMGISTTSAVVILTLALTLSPRNMHQLSTAIWRAKIPTAPRARRNNCAQRHKHYYCRRSNSAKNSPKRGNPSCPASPDIAKDNFCT